MIKKVVFFVFVAVILLIQLFPVDRSNPPATAPLDAPAAVTAILRTSCYDCHSSETVWPWYSRVAPVSWLVAHDVEEGREHLDFSNWGALSDTKRTEFLAEIAEVTAEGEMPLAAYTLIHRDAKLTADQVATLRAWSAAGE